MRAKSAGQTVAIILLVVGAGAVGVAVLSRAPAPQASPTFNGREPALLELPPLAGKTVADPTSGSGVQDLVSLADRGVWTRVDPLTGRLASKITWERLEPAESGLFEITRPLATIFEVDRTVEVRASRGTVLWPSRELEPESGKLLGDVEATMLRPASHQPAGDSTPLASLTTQSLTFQSALGELRSDEDVRVHAQGVRATARGLTLQFTSDPAMPIALVRIHRGGTVSYDPRLGLDLGQDQSKDDASASSRPGSTNAPASPARFYHATLVGDLKLASGSRRLEGNAASIWLREGGPDAPSPSTQPANTAGDKPASGSAEKLDDPLTFIWSGPFELLPLGAAPPELAEDSLALRIDAQEGGHVLIADDSGGARVEAATIEYAATTRRIVALGTKALPVRLFADTRTSLSTLAASLDLPGGVGILEGPGSISIAPERSDPGPVAASAADAAAPSRGLTWNDGGDIFFDTSAGPIGSANAPLRSVVLRGGVQAFDAGACLNAKQMTAFFRTVTDDARRQSPALRRLLLDGEATAQDARGARISAAQFDLQFQSRHGLDQPVPVLAIAHGNVRAEQEGRSFAAAHVTARLHQDSSGDAQVTHVSATGDVRLRLERSTLANARSGEDKSAGQGSSEPPSSGFITAASDSLEAVLPTSTATLVGSPARLGYESDAGTAEMEAGSFTLDGSESARALTAFGAGTARFHAAGPDPDKVQASWSGAMIYSDAQGRAELIGAVSAVADIRGTDRYAATGERVILKLDLDSDSSSGGAGQLSSATIEGSDAPAEIILKRFAAAPARAPAGVPAAPVAGTEEAPLESMAVVRGPTIVLDPRRSAIRVDGAGLLLLENPGAPAPAASPASVLSDSADPRGTALFEWSTSMSIDRSSGEALLEGAVRARHKRPGAARFDELTCDRLRALTSEAAGDDGASITLTRVEASGAIRARYGSIWLEGVNLVFDAAGNRVVVSGTEARPATAFDEAAGRSFSAQEVTVDLASGSWSASGASTVTAPR